MNWKKLKDIAWFIFVFVLAINLIEHESNEYLVEFAGDVFGATSLTFLGVWQALKDD